MKVQICLKLSTVYCCNKTVTRLLLYLIGCYSSLNHRNSKLIAIRTLPKHEKAATFFSHTKRSPSSDTHQTMKTSDSDPTVNRNTYPDAATCDRMPLIGPKSVQLGPITRCLLEEPQWHLLPIIFWKSSFSHWGSSGKQRVIGPNWTLLGPIRGILSHVAASGCVFRLAVRSLSDVFMI